MTFHFASPKTSDVAENLRREVRQFLAAEMGNVAPSARAESWNGFDPDFSKRLGDRGWIGMTWPKKYGGQERSELERYVVIEELLAAGAPVMGHWIADRQSGPTLLRYGTEKQRQEILPRIASGQCFFGIGMSEPDSGSDLSSVKTRAVPTDGGFIVNGTKLWTTNAHNCHYLILFCKTDTDSEDRHAGMSQFLVDLTLPGITIRPVLALTGEHHFNEVSFSDVFLATDTVIGKLGQGWNQVMGELAYERSGPDRFLSSFTVLNELIRKIGSDPSERQAEALGRIIARLMVLRRMSLSVAAMLQNRDDPSLQAAIVKDLGATLEQEIPEIARQLIAVEPEWESDDALAAVLGYTIQHAPSFSLRGGTREILRGIIARGMGLR